MSTWAEVVEPSTRALVDNDSEEEVNDSQSVESLTRTELVWKGEENISDINLFIIVHGDLSTSFTTRFVYEEHQELIAQVQEYKRKEPLVKETTSATSSATGPSLKTSPIYRINENSCICLCRDTDNNNVNKFRNAILPFLEKSAQVVIVSSQKASTYLYDRSLNDVTPPFIRCLHSSSYKPKGGEMHLEQPNIITGIPAAVLSWCEVFQKPGILFCCFSDTYELNSISAEPFVKLFSNLPYNVFDPSKVTFQKHIYGASTARSCGRVESKQSNGPESTNLYL